MFGSVKVVAAAETPPTAAEPWLMSVGCARSTKEETRSASPHCPKPDEPEEPRGTAMETEAEGQ